MLLRSRASAPGYARLRSCWLHPRSYEVVARDGPPNSCEDERYDEPQQIAKPAWFWFALRGERALSSAAFRLESLLRGIG